MQNSKLPIRQAQGKQLKIQKFIKTLHFALCTLHSRQGRAGQALVTLLFFSIVAITITSAAVIVAVTQAKTGNTVGLSNEVYYLAESGVENALLRLLRDPNYTGEQLVLPNSTISITVTGANPKTIISQSSASGILRKIEVQADYTNAVLSVLSWKEVE